MSYLALSPKHPLKSNFFSQDLESLINQCFNTPECQSACSSEGSYVPAVDIQENDEAFIIKADVPGIAKDDLKIDILDDTVTIQGHRSNETEEKKDNYHRAERNYGSFRRRFQIPRGFMDEDAKAQFDNGVLTLTLPKQEVKKPKRIEVLGN